MSANAIPFYPAPSNKFGIIGANVFFSDEEWQRLFDGPIAACESAYLAEIAKPVDLRELAA